MVRIMMAGIAALAASAGHAQDLGGVYDLGQMGRDMSYSATMKGQGRRAGKRETLNARSVQTCRNARRMARPAGEKGVMYDKLRAICTQHGH